MARSEKVPVRHGSEESAELFPGRDTDVSFDKSDPVNDRAWKGAEDKYVPRESRAISPSSRSTLARRRQVASKRGVGARASRPLPWEKLPSAPKHEQTGAPPS
jgi:hypothetical protein